MYDALRTNTWTVSTDIERAISTMARQSNGSLIMLASPLGQANREMILKLVAQHRLPAVYPFRYYVASGGLMSYGSGIMHMRCDKPHVGGLRCALQCTQISGSRHVFGVVNSDNLTNVGGRFP